MDMSDLAQREHENMIAALALFCANVQGSVVRQSDGVELILTGLPIRLFNQVLVAGPQATPDALAAAVAATRARGDRFIVSLRVGTDDRFVPLMAELGLVPASAEPWLPGMAQHPIPPGAVLSFPGHVIRQVTDAAGLDDHITTAAAGFEMPEAWLRDVMKTTMLERSDTAVYVGYTDGVPVTTGAGFRTGTTIGVYNIATIESARKRGYGAAMTARVAADGAAAGCDVAILQASEMGYPIYERLGFRRVVDYMGYIDPSSLTPAAT